MNTLDLVLLCTAIIAVGLFILGLLSKKRTIQQKDLEIQLRILLERWLLVLQSLSIRTSPIEHAQPIRVAHGYNQAVEGRYTLSAGDGHVGTLMINTDERTIDLRAASPLVRAELESQLGPGTYQTGKLRIIL